MPKGKAAGHGRHDLTQSERAIYHVPDGRGQHRTAGHDTEVGLMILPLKPARPQAGYGRIGLK